MSATRRYRHQRLAVGVFHEAAPLQRVLNELVADGIEMDKITVIAGRSSLERFGWALQRSGRESEGVPTAGIHCGDAGGTLPLMHFVEVGLAGQSEPLLASFGGWAALLVQWVRSENRDLAGLLEHRLDPSHAGHIQQQLEAGAVTLWVGIQDGAEEQRVCRVLLRNSSEPVHVHDIGTELPS